MDQHTESGWKHDPQPAREKCEMNFRNNLTAFSWKEAFEQIKSKFSPDVIFTLCDDRHQDHCVLSDLAWNTFRTHLILDK